MVVYGSLWYGLELFGTIWSSRFQNLNVQVTKKLEIFYCIWFSNYSVWA